MSTAYAINGMGVVQIMKNAGSATFGELANKYFQVITAHLGNNGCNRVHVVFDHKEKEDLIKEAELARRGSSSSFEVRSPSTPVPKKWQNFISNPVNKSNLKAFLGTAWKEMAKTRLTATRNWFWQGVSFTAMTRSLSLKIKRSLLHSLSISCGNALKCNADGKQPVIYDCY